MALTESLQVQTKYTHPSNTFSKRMPLNLSFSKGFPGCTRGKESTCQCRRCKIQGADPWVGKTPWGRKYYPLQYSSLGNPVNRGAWWAIVHGITESDAIEHAKEKSKLGGWVWTPCTGWRRLPNLLSCSGKQWNHWIIRLRITMEILHEKRAACYNKLNTFIHLSFSSVI